MNPLSLASLATIVLLARTVGRPKAVRALTFSQATIRAIPGRRNQDIGEIQRQSEQTAEQMLQLGESVYDANWSDPDLKDAADLNLFASLEQNVETGAALA